MEGERGIGDGCWVSIKIEEVRGKGERLGGGDQRFGAAAINGSGWSVEGGGWRVERGKRETGDGSAVEP